MNELGLQTNKLLKRDSQRVAFLLCVGLSDYGGMRRLWYCVAHPLAGRYASRYSDSSEKAWIAIKRDFKIRSLIPSGSKL
ncbi:DUF3265 domain-containing protein [Vibrio parahaemolyticus]|nr:DUF3265 domain-containing protein [Vibrio parahaemolyticus]